MRESSLEISVIVILGTGGLRLLVVGVVGRECEGEPPRLGDLGERDVGGGGGRGSQLWSTLMRPKVLVSELT